MIGVAGAVSGTALLSIAAGGVAGGAGAGYMASSLLQKKLVDENYEQVLNFVTMQLMKKFSDDKTMDPVLKSNKLQQVVDLTAAKQSRIYSLEKALLLMYDPIKEFDNFKGSPLGNIRKDSREEVLKRVKCISIIHNIRRIFAKQCYIGIVGIQNAGKVHHSEFSNSLITLHKSQAKQH